MNTKQSKSTYCSQEQTVLLSQSIKEKNYLQIYKIKVDDLKSQSCKKQGQRSIYLNIKFNDNSQIVTQTPCIDIINDNKFFQIKTKTDIEKVEVLDYDNLKKLSKISLKGINKQFKHTHVEQKSGIQIQIQRKNVDLSFFNRKCKLSQSIMIDNQMKEKNEESTDDSSSQVSV